MKRRVFAGLIGALLLLGPVNAARAAPSNDDFANATEIAAFPYLTTVETEGATREVGESQCQFSPYPSSTPTVWYGATSPESGTITVSIEGNGYPAAFRRSPTADVTGRPIGLTIGACASYYDSAHVNVAVEAGETIYFQVTLYAEEEGEEPAILRAQFIPPVPPVNDDRARALEIGSLPFEDRRPTHYATEEPDEPACEYWYPHATVWYRYRPTDDVVVDFSTQGSDYYTVLAWYRESPSGLVRIACDDPFDDVELPSVTLAAGGTYFLQVSGDFEPGQLVLRVGLHQPSPAADDDFAKASSIESLPTTFVTDVGSATVEPGEPTGCVPYRTTWFRYTAPEDGTISVDTHGSSAQSVAVGVFKGDSLLSLAQLACAQDYHWEEAFLSFDASAGETYHVQAGTGYPFSDEVWGITVTLDRWVPPADPGAISGSSPFPAGCTPAGPGYTDSEVEPSVAVNPTNHDNIVAAWQQDRYSNGAARSNLVGVSKDAGRTWRTVVVPGLSRCSGGELDRATDPWLSIGPDGIAYLASLSADRPGGPSAVLVSRSLDGGESWQEPVTVAADDEIVFNDKEAVTADPTAPGHAYVVWYKETVTFFARTTDGGETWSSPVPIWGAAQGNQIAVLGDGTLVNVFYDIATGTLRAMRSVDKGLAWLPPVVIAAVSSAEGPVDPSTGERVRAGGYLPAVDAGPSGVYAVWRDGRSIQFSRSMDGLVWGLPAIAAQGMAAMFTPSVAVAGDGTVGITYYDFRLDTEAIRTTLTDVWFSFSRDAGASWSERHVSGSFDLHRAPYSDGRGWFLGDYQGLTARGNGFAAVFAKSVPRGLGRYTNVYFASLEP